MSPRTRFAFLALLVAAAPALGVVPLRGNTLGAAGAQAGTPQRFELGAGERTGFGFAVGQPGPIVVTVQAQGAPLIVSIVKPGGATVDQPVSGNGTVQYTATADDVKKGMLWSVSVRLAQAVARPAATGGRGRPLIVDVSTAASGMVTIKSPPGDMQRAQAELNATSGRAKAALASQRAPAAPDIAAQVLVRLRQDEAAQQTRQLEQNRAKLTPDVYQKVAQVIAARAQGRAVALEARTVGVAPPGMVRAGRGGVSTTQGASTGAGGSSTGGAQPVGSSPAQTVLADPAVLSLDVSEGRPGNYVLVTGTNFLDTPGEVHFMVAPGKDLKGTVGIWNNTQIYVSVPDIEGVSAFSGQMYVVRGTKPSKLVPFRFLPTLATETLLMTEDRIIKQPYDVSELFINRFGSGDFFGARGDDSFYLSTQLKNGWVVETADITLTNQGGSSDAYVIEQRPGTASPYIKVHWWRDAFSYFSYQPRIVIVGPKGLPPR